MFGGVVIKMIMEIIAHSYFDSRVMKNTGIDYSGLWCSIHNPGRQILQTTIESTINMRHNIKIPQASHTTYTMKTTL